MVVIEEAEEEQPQLVTVSNTSKNDRDVEEDDAETRSVISKDVSDGFETASDGGDSTVSGGDDDDDVAREQQQKRSFNGESEQLPQPVAAAVATKDDSYEDALNDDQLKQKTLAQANDAKAEGNELFKDGKYEDALLKYELALQVAPEVPKIESPPQAPSMPPTQESAQAASEMPTHESAQTAEKPKVEPAVQVAPEMTPVVELRSICHSNRGVCFLKLGKYDETVKECSKALELNPSYVKAFVRRGEAYEKLERYDEAISDMKKILELDPSNYQARRNIVRLEPLAREKMEKMKDEMIGKLKDMGNSILGRVGMSVDNFKAVQDPNTGSYSISFQR